MSGNLPIVKRLRSFVAGLSIAGLLVFQVVSSFHGHASDLRSEKECVVCHVLLHSPALLTAAPQVLSHSETTTVVLSVCSAPASFDARPAHGLSPPLV